VVEAAAEAVFANPAHDYTRTLMAAVLASLKRRMKILFVHQKFPGSSLPCSRTQKRGHVCLR